ncbi:Protein svp26 [Frankliniella fusca]|uniref:Protein svp26 n=1 Tax=Frankliniella fusca TaxID=407009 RepID=A0AAE1LJY9_9NEOP|nr:Protein svp26 [Frankliniella fusca]
MWEVQPSIRKDGHHTWLTPNIYMEKTTYLAVGGRQGEEQQRDHRHHGQAPLHPADKRGHGQELSERAAERYAEQEEGGEAGRSARAAQSSRRGNNVYLVKYAGNSVYLDKYAGNPVYLTRYTLNLRVYLVKYTGFPAYLSKYTLFPAYLTKYTLFPEYIFLLSFGELQEAGGDRFQHDEKEDKREGRGDSLKEKVEEEEEDEEEDQRHRSPDGPPNEINEEKNKSNTCKTELKKKYTPLQSGTAQNQTKPNQAAGAGLDRQWHLDVLWRYWGGQKDTNFPLCTMALRFKKTIPPSVEKEHQEPKTAGNSTRNEGMVNSSLSPITFLCLSYLRKGR